MLNTNQTPTQIEGKFTKKKLKKTRIVGGEGEFKYFLLKDRLDFLLNNLKKALEDNKIKNLIKAMNMNTNDYTFNEAGIKNEISKTSVDYTQDNINKIENIVKYTLLCLIYPLDDNTYKLLYDLNTLYVEKPHSLNNITINDTDKTKLESKANAYYKQFKTSIITLNSNNNIQTNAVYDYIISYIYDVYDGIVLLTVQKDGKLNLRVYDADNKPSATSFAGREITENNEIRQFFKIEKNYLIIKKNEGDKDNYIYDYIYDCMMQIIYKIVSVLIDNIEYYEIYLNYKLKLLKKIIDIIVEKANTKENAIDTGLITSPNKEDKYLEIKHYILLKSLKTIMFNMFNSKANTGITSENIDKIYISKLKEINQGSNPSFEEPFYNAIIDKSNNKSRFKKISDAINVLGKRCNNETSTESFQHIINVLGAYDDIDYKKLLIKLSTSLFSYNCDATIEKIITEKSYLLSKARIMSLYLEEMYIEIDNSQIESKRNQANREYKTYKTTINNLKAEIKDKDTKTKKKLESIINDYIKKYNKKYSENITAISDE
jgi:hypothetical protein